MQEQQIIIESKAQNLISYAKKVVSMHRRAEKALEIRKKFENNISKFVREFIKVCEQCDSSDSYHKIQAPAPFLSELLTNIESRIKQMEDNIKELEDVIRAETIPAQLTMLVHTISLLQDRFIMVSGLACDVHKKVINLHNKVAGFMNDVHKADMPTGFFTPKDGSDLLAQKADELLTTSTWFIDPKLRDIQLTEEKDASRPPVMKTPYTSLREAIVGRAGMLQGRAGMLQGQQFRKFY